MADDDLDYERDLPDLPVSELAEQFPAIAGNPQAEIEQRSVDGVSDGQFVKVFIVDREVASDSPMHAMNAVAVLQEATQRGLHPKGDVFLVDMNTVHSRRSVSTELTYAVDVVPASVDHEPETTVAPSDLHADRQGTAAATAATPVKDTKSAPKRRRSTAKR